MGQRTWTMKHVMGSYCWDLQREVSMVPLMRVEGYRADGGDGGGYVDVARVHRSSVRCFQRHHCLRGNCRSFVGTSGTGEGHRRTPMAALTWKVDEGAVMAVLQLDLSGLKRQACVSACRGMRGGGGDGGVCGRGR